MRGRRILVSTVAMGLTATGCWHVPNDYSWDRRADVVWTTQDDGLVSWWSDRNADSPMATLATVDAFPVAGDFDGDGRYDHAVAAWWDRVELADGTEVTWELDVTEPCVRPDTSNGVPGIVAVTGDWDGDRSTDLGWYCPADARWWLPGQAEPVAFGQPYDPAHPAAWDVPAPGDYDGDGITELGVYRLSDGTYWALGDDEPIASGFGIGLPVPADYDGDGSDDPVVYSFESDAPWEFADGARLAGPGGPGYPAPADYDGDGTADLAVLSGSTFHLDGGSTVMVPHPGALPAALSSSNRDHIVAITWMAERCQVEWYDAGDCPRPPL